MARSKDEDCVEETEELSLEELIKKYYGFTEQSKATRCEHVDGFSFWRWPETQALLARLGFDVQAPTTKFLLYVGIDDPVKIHHEFVGLDTTEERVRKKT
jgi:hypothetical protein